MIKKIGIDLHGVIDNNTELFTIISTPLILTDIEIYVISGPPKDEVVIELNKLSVYQGVHYTEVFTIVDFLKKQKDIKMWKDYKDTWWASDKNWWGAKAKICEMLNIDLMIDDREEYKEDFKNIKTKFLLYTGQD